jgi:prepilin-type N-terminal cleavage/methylation domain-containing protein
MTAASAQGVTAGRRPGGARGVTLVELLVVIAILSVVSAMLVFTWIGLSNSFAGTTRSSDARDFARQAASRMERELRDAEAQLTTGHYMGLPAVLWASANQITFVTTFNDAGNDVPEANPLAVMYYVDVDKGTLYMKRDANDDGQWDSAKARALVRYVVNGSVGASGATPVFSYTYIGDDGTFVTARPTDDAASLSAYERGRIVSVTFTLLVDLNPGHSPTHMTLTSTAQLRNQRQF